MSDSADGTEPDGFLTAEEERDLIERIQTGEYGAFRQLLDAHEPIVDAVVGAWENEEWRSEVEDVARQALQDAWLDYDPDKGRFGAFARTVVHRRVTDALRGFYSGDRPRTTVDLDERADPEDPDSDPNREYIAHSDTEPGAPGATDAALAGPGDAEINRQMEFLRQRADLVQRVLNEYATDFTPRQRFVVKALWQGHSIQWMTDFLDDQTEDGTVRIDSVRRTLNRAVEKIEERVQWIETERYTDPFAAVEGEQEAGVVDPFAQVEAEEAERQEATGQDVPGVGSYTQQGGQW